MAMSDTMSSSTDWAQLYQLNNLAGSSTAAPQHDATVVTTTVSTSTMAPAALSPEGRVSKPPRRRRASRAAPTTLLNTDTTNFRAMVQQFTGVPSAAFTFGTSTTTHHGQMSGPSLSFGLAQQQQQQQHMNVGVGPRHQQSGYSNYIANNRYQQQQPRFYSQQQQQYVFPFNSGGGENIVGYGMSDGGTTSARANNMEMSSDGYVMDHGGHLFHHGSSPSSDGNRTSNSHHGYNL